MVTNDIDVLWWTDHDSFYYPPGTASADGFDFEEGTVSESIPGWPSTVSETLQWHLSDYDTNPLAAGALTVDPAYAHSGSYGARLSGGASATGVDEQETYYLGVNPHFQFKALLGQVSLSFWVRPVTTDPDAEFEFIVPLNATHSGEANPHTDSHRRIVFYHGSVAHPSLSDDGLTVWVPITATEGTWAEVSGDLTALAVDAWGETDAHDLHAEMASLRIVASSGAAVEYDVDDLSWSMATTGGDLLDEQSNYLSSLGSSPHQFLGMEVSLLPEGHFNVYGGSVPFLPYDTDDTLDAAALSDWAHSYGALVSYNHMFGVSMHRSSASDRATAVEEAVDRLVANDAWGADILEIGYRTRGGILSDFLTVWDAIGMSGLYLTGVGALDLHDELDYATFTNNFVTFVGLATLSETGALSELQRGNAWFADPTYFTGGHMTMTIASPEVSGLKMGSVVVGRSTACPLRLTLSEVPAHSEIHLVENGLVTQTWNIVAARRWVQSVTVDPTGGNVVRVEVVSATGGNPIAYTNPVYFVPSGTAGVPNERRIVVR